MVGLSLAASLSVGGCGGTGSDNSSTFIDPNAGPNAATATATELTRVVYQFGNGGLNSPAGAAFYNISLLDASGAAVQAGPRGNSAGTLQETFVVGSQVQVLVPDDAVSLVRGTRIDVLGGNGALLARYEIPITVSKNQATLVNSGQSSTPALSSIAVGTTNRQGQTSIDQGGVLQVSSGTQYPLILQATYGTGANATQTRITGGATFSVAPSNLGIFQDNVFIPSASVAPGSLGNITATFQGQTTVQMVNVTGLASPSPTVSPSPSASPSASPSPGASPSASPSPGTSPSASPSGSPSVNGVQLFITSTTIRNSSSTPFGVNATVNGTSVNVTSLPGVNVTITSSNTNVILADLPNQRLNGVGVGTSIVNSTVTVPNVGNATSANFLMTVNP